MGSTSEFFQYELPEDRIAQRPKPRGESLLLHARQQADAGWKIEDHPFQDLPELLSAGDLLVFNNSKVLPTRFFIQVDEGTRDVEILLVRRISVGVGEQWEALARPMRLLGMGAEFKLSPHLRAWVRGRTSDDARLLLDIAADETEKSVRQIIEEEGIMPIPPYIRDGKADEEDKEQYQTVYAALAGSVAAPTAGLHFTEELFEKLDAKQVERCFVTHHVGPASFLPVRSDWESHRMLPEQYLIPEQTTAKIRAAKRGGRRVIAVGTTAVRALESALRPDGGGVKPGFTETDLYITPGFRFAVVDALVTNFHQPRSTHLLLVAAFIGEEQTDKIYKHALQGRYRFLSYGDAMFLEPQRREKQQ